HHVAQVTVRHQRGTLGAARDIAQLLERVGLVRTENLDVTLRSHLGPRSLDIDHWTLIIGHSSRDEGDSRPAGSPRLRSQINRTRPALRCRAVCATAARALGSRSRTAPNTR